jgi:hypothetical protein
MLKILNFTLAIVHVINGEVHRVSGKADEMNNIRVEIPYYYLLIIHTGKSSLSLSNRY